VFATWKKFSQHGKMCSQHSQHTSQHHDPTADMFPDSNRVAKEVFDASVRIGRPGASSTEKLMNTLKDFYNCNWMALFVFLFLDLAYLGSRLFW
jgi:hypothetical protein